MLKRLACLSLVAFVAACTGNVTLGKAPSAASPGDGNSDGTSNTGPYGITCKTYWRQGGTNDELQEQTFTTRSDAIASKTIGYPPSNGQERAPAASIDFAFAPANDGTPESLLTVKVSGQQSAQVYRLNPTRRPIGQFVGDHGFTGLLYVGGANNGGADLQYICSADGATPPPRGNATVPLDLLCQFEFRNAPAGAIEHRETLEYKTDPARSATFVPQEKTYADFGISLSVSDDPFDARAVHVGAKTLSGEQSVAQLFQLDRNAQTFNQLAGTTISGRVSLVSAQSHKEVSYACSARSGANSGGPASCPAVADSCSASCTTASAVRYDPVRNCQEQNSSVVSCAGSEYQTLDLTCTVRSDGVVMLGSGSLRGIPGFSECPAGVFDKASKAPRCAPGGDSCDDLASIARNALDGVITANSQCNVDADCEQVAFSADCFDSCTRSIAKTGLTAFNQKKSEMNGGECSAFKTQRCEVTIPPCEPPTGPRCVDHVCQ
jgi:hypothetical protein